MMKITWTDLVLLSGAVSMTQFLLNTKLGLCMQATAISPWVVTLDALREFRYALGQYMAAQLYSGLKPSYHPRASNL